MPNNADRRRKTFVRDLQTALLRAGADGDLDPLNDALRQVRRWVARPVNRGVDPRVTWSFWLNGDLSDGTQARIKPLEALLKAPGVPETTLAELLTLTGRMAEMPQREPPTYHAVPVHVWLRVAHVPGVIDLLTGQGLPNRWAQLRPAGTPWFHPWAQALVSVVLDLEQGVGPVVMARRRAAFNAVVNQGWLPPDALDSWAAPRPVVDPHAPIRAVHRMTLVPPDPQAPGSLVDFLAASETPGGLLDHWRTLHPHDWSTRVSPASGTTVWAGLLLNPNPALLAACLQDDHDALDRPAPVGHWHDGNFRNHAGDPAQFRSVAGRTASRGDLQVVERSAPPEEVQRIRAWWDDPAPTLRQTLNVWWNVLAPLNDRPHEHAEAWRRLLVQVEQQDLRRALAVDAPMGPRRPPRRL